MESGPLVPHTRTWQAILKEKCMSDDEGGWGGSILTWGIFLLIFGVGNVVLYYTTGFVLIPK